MNYDDTEAAHYCRSLVIDDIGALDLPNIYELIILYLEGDNIDALDPTADEYPDLKLGCSATVGRFYNTSCSSTVWDCDSVFCITYYGMVTDSIKVFSYTVIPVSEL